MTHTDRLTVVTSTIQSIITKEAANIPTSLKSTTANADGSFQVVTSDNIYYGDQERIPRSPAVCIEPGLKTRELEGAPQQTRNTFNVYILVYALGPELMKVRAQCDEIGEAIETLLHKDLQLRNGLPPGSDNETVIHGFVQSFESSYAFRPGLVRTVRMLWQGTTKTRLF
jgi:hypothetical protein